MISSPARTILVTGATGGVGRLVVDELLRAGIRVRALTRRPDRALLPSDAEVRAGDLTAPASLDSALESVDAVFLIWTAPIATAAAVVDRIAAQPSGAARRIVYLSAPHQTPHPFFFRRVGSPARSFSQWAADNAAAFTRHQQEADTQGSKSS